MTEVQWSQLQRDPKMVADLANDQEVRVTRRDGPDLVLLRADKVDASRSAIRGAAALLRVIAQQADLESGHLLPFFHAAFPWSQFLPRHELKEFADQFLGFFAASADLDSWGRVEQLLHEWRATAMIHADPELAAALSGPIDADLGPAAPPAHAEAG